MLTSLCLIVLGLACAVSQYDFTANQVVPTYIQRALRQKDRYKPLPHEKKRTLSNLTLTDVFEKIKEITKSLNQNAKRNGYKVDYKFRILDNN